MHNYPIDINCDMGESIGDLIIGQDEKLMPFISSCNIACGYHGGDPYHMQKTIELALKHNVRIGAHPSYPDLEGFGRRAMRFEKEELKALLFAQIGSLQQMVKRFGGELSYVKPHGALYNKASVDTVEAETIIEAIQSVNSSLALMGLAGSRMQRVAHKKGIEFIAEAFCDRKYEGDGPLMSRAKEGAVYTNVNEVLFQVKAIVFDKKVMISSAKSISINADSICIHGDNPMALEFLVAIQKMFKNNTDEN